MIARLLRAWTLVPVVLVVLAACAGSNSTPSTHEPIHRSANLVATCSVLTDVVAADSRSGNPKSRAQLRTDFGYERSLLAQLSKVAPRALGGRVGVLLANVDRSIAVVNDPSFRFDPRNTLYVWQTRDSQVAGRAIAAWASRNCRRPIDRTALEPETVAVCLAPNAGDDAAQALFGRVQMPSRRGPGTDFVDGVIGAADVGTGISVTFQPTISAARRAQILADLASLPVVAVVRHADQCPG